MMGIWREFWRPERLLAIAVMMAVSASMLGLGLLMTVMSPAQPVEGQSSVPCYRAQGGAKWVAGDGCEWEMQSGSTLDVQSGVTATMNDLTVADFAGITAQGVITLTNNAVLTATGSLQPILAEGAIGIDGGTNIAHVADYLMLVNIGSQTITFTETTGLISAGNVALGAGDASTLVWADGGWIEIARSNN